MALSQRPAARFFAAFYRWNIYTQRPRPCAIASQCARNVTHPHHGSCAPRSLHATRLLRQQDQQEQDYISAIIQEDTQHLSDSSVSRISQPGEHGQDMPVDISEAELETEALKSSVRGLMRKVPSSVAVVTVASVDPNTNQQVPMGVSVSSLSTVTLDPPTISFNIKEPSQTLSAIREANGLFRVHFTRGDRGGANIVDHFSRGNHESAYNLRLKDMKLHMPKNNKKKVASQSSAPQIWDDSVMAAMECKITHEFPVADHVILVARVDSMEQKAGREPAVIYVDGRYQRANGDMIVSAGRPKSVALSNQGWTAWDYPLFPGAHERQDYMERAKAHIKKAPQYLENPTKETYRKLEIDFPYPPGAFGINMRVLVAECRKELGYQKHMDSNLAAHQAISDFYGPLTPSMRQRIVERAKKFIAADERFIEQDYRSLLYSLGVSPTSRDFLPSDIMEPLRAAGLAQPFELQKRRRIASTDNILEAEQIEHRLRGYLKERSYDIALRTRFEDAMHDLGEKKTAAYIFKKARSRLLNQTHPEYFDASLIDIEGEVTPEEMRVVMCRIIKRLDIRALTQFRKALSLDWCELLRTIGVNPTISGMDVEFLMGKIKHLFFTVRQYRDFPPAVDQMLDPFFERSVDWEDLESRVRHFVQNLTHRATTWPNEERLAAMGLHWNATVTLPRPVGVSSSQEKRTSVLNRGHILETLMAKELKSRYGHGTDDENAAIARYLKNTYDFDVTQQLQQKSEEPAARVPLSSGDEMEQAMMEYVVKEKDDTSGSAPARDPRGIGAKPYGERLSRRPMGKNLVFRKI